MGGIPQAGCRPEPDLGRLAWLIDPIGPAEFQREFFERRLCLVERPEPNYYADLLSLRDLDLVLGTHDVRHPGIRLARGEDDIPVSAYTHESGRIDPLGVAKQFDQGTTVIFDQAHRRVPRLGAFCASLGEVFGSRVQANVYLTPPSAQGFRPHWDTHDVFVLQISGRKHWSTHGTKVKLPVRGQRFDPERDSATSIGEQFDLGPGSLAYIPRGLMHSARSADESSLHITVGLTTYTWTDLFLESVAAAALQDSELRQSLPFRLVREDYPAEERDRLVREKLKRLLVGLVPDEVWKNLRDRLLAENSPALTDLLESRVCDSAVTETSRFRHRPAVDLSFEAQNDGCTLCLLGQEVRFPASMTPAASFIASCSSEAFSVREIPGCLDLNEKIGLTKRLVAEGLLQAVSDE